MDKFKGTKGEWYIKYMEERSDAFFWVKSDENDVVHYGTDIMADDYGEQNGYPMEQRLADARAIVQVPQMIKLLLHIVESEDVNLNDVHQQACDLLEKMKII